jgi:hypothetical protein
VKRRLAAALAMAAALACTGCWSFMTGAKGFTPARAQGVAAPHAILRVNEAGIAWGNGDFGAQLHRALLDASLFERVYYPVEPPEPPEWIIEVQALGRMNEASLWAVIAATATGWFFFLPAPVLPYFEDYGVTCEVRVLRGDAPPHSFQVETQATVIHAIFADPESFVAKAKERVFRELVDRVVDGIARAPLPATASAQR